MLVALYTLQSPDRVAPAKFKGMLPLSVESVPCEHLPVSDLGIICKS